MDKINVVCWKWRPRQRYRSDFGPKTVNVLYSMIRRHFASLGSFICVTDEPNGLDTNIQIVKGWNDYADIPSPHGGHNPSCYRRLRAFAPGIESVLGERFVSLDLDTVITGDLDPLWDRQEDFVAWGETNPKSYYNGSMFLLRAGTRPKVWEQFDPKTSPAKAKAAGKFGSDQGWISYCLGPGEAKWTTADGVYSYNVHLRHQTNTLPAGARIVMFHGATDPWSPAAQQLAWVKQHWN